ncbi:MAG: hypothetical protein V4760_07335 [Bdellovibrionota bacterium]
MKSVWFLFTFIALASIGCSEAASSGASVSLPYVYVNCTTSHCMTNTALNPTIITFITTSGCVAPDLGFTRSASTNAISCSAATGCYGQITGWIDANGNSTSSIPSGTYSVCTRIDYNRDYPASTTGDSTGTKDNVAIGATTANQFVTTWTDL